MIPLRIAVGSRIAVGESVSDKAAGTQTLDDAKLLNLVRAGDTTAFGVLYERHVQALRRLAQELVESPAEADHLVAETFTLLHDVTLRGGGPTDAFRPYALAILQRASSGRLRGAQPQVLADSQQLPGLGEPLLVRGELDSDRPWLVHVYLSLPARWQAVLWHTEIERSDPAEASLILGVTRPGTGAALHRRVMDGLRQSYLQDYSSRTGRPQCEAVADHLAGHFRGALRSADAAAVTEHLSECPQCAAVCEELADFGLALREQVAPAFLGAAAAGYLAAAEQAVTSASPAAPGPQTRPMPAHHDPAARTAPRLRHAVLLSAGFVAAVAGISVALALTGGNPPPAQSRHGLAAGGPSATSPASGHSPGPAGSHAASPSSRSKTDPPASKRTSTTAPTQHPTSAPPTTRSPKSPAPAPSPTATPSPTPSVVLAASVSVNGFRGNRDQVVFGVTDSGTAATGELTVSITLPSGSSMIGSGFGRGGQSSWSCQPSGSGATCTHDAIAAGGQVQGSIVIASEGSACGQQVQVTATSGGQSASATSTQGIQCGQGGNSLTAALLGDRSGLTVS
jgi:DNA-directed RNA polymerase specialized sigma24 family protein